MMKHAYWSACSLLAATFLTICSASQGLAADGKPAPMAVDKNDPRSGALINAIAAKRKHATQMPVYKVGAVKTINNNPVNNPAADATAQDTQSETTVVDLGGGKLVAAFNDSGSFLGGADHFTGYSFSSNNGKTWTDGGALPNSTEGDAGDPVLAVNKTTGAVYMATLGFNTFENLQVFKSVDSGHTWGAPVNGTPGYGGSGDFQDKSWLTVDNFSGSGNGNIYLCWTNFGADAEIRLTRSTNGGATFGPNLGTLIATQAPGDNVQGCNVVVSPNHQVNVFYYRREGNGKLYVRRSTDQGVTFGSETLIANLNTTGINGNLNLNGGLRSNSFPQAAVNPSAARPFIYVIYNDDPSPADNTDNGAIYMVTSTNNGATWSVPIVVNNAARDQFFPAIGITSEGERFMVSWYSRVQDPNNSMFHRRGQLGVLDGTGNPVFNPNNFQLGANTPVVIGQDPVINSTYMGDYDSIAGGNRHLTATWADNRTGNSFHARQPDVFSAQIGAKPSTSDVSVLVTPNPATIDLGGTTSVALQVTATGGLAKDVYLSMVQTAGLPIQSFSSSGPCTLINGFLDCPLGKIRSGTFKTVTVVLRGVAAGRLTVAARATTSSIDANTNNNRGTAKIKVRSGSTVTQTFSTGDVAIPLPDVATTDISLPVGVTGTATVLKPEVRFNHTFDGDLSLFLIDPANNSVELSSHNGGGGDNYGSGANSCSGSVLTTFDDGAATSITAGAPPFAGVFKPEVPLSNLAGSAVNGTWKLRVVDSVAGDSGTFFCFKLTITRIP